MSKLDTEIEKAWDFVIISASKSEFPENFQKAFSNFSEIYYKKKGVKIRSNVSQGDVLSTIFHE